MVYNDTVPTIAELKANTLLQLFKRGYDTLRNTIISLITGKQDKLTAGEGIEIANNVISTTPAGEVYTKAEVNTLLEGKADTNSVVTLNTVQNIYATKIFKADLMVNKSTPNITMKTTTKISEITQSTLMGTLPIYDGDSKQVGAFTVRRYASETRTILQTFNASTTEKTMVLYNQDNNTAYVTVPTRAYSTSNVNDVVTIGSLASNPNVVHTTGNESIAGIKTFSDSIKFVDANHSISKFAESTRSNVLISASSPNGTTDVRFYVRANDDGTVSLVLGKWIGGSFTSTVVSTL